MSTEATDREALELPDSKVAVDVVTLMCAVRYALGRHSYVVGSVCRDLEMLAPKLDEKTRATLARDIGEAIDRSHSAGSVDYLAASDALRWEQAKRALEVPR